MIESFGMSIPDLIRSKLGEGDSQANAVVEADEDV